MCRTAVRGCAGRVLRRAVQDSENWAVSSELLVQPLYIVYHRVATICCSGDVEEGERTRAPHSSTLLHCQHH